MPQRFPPLTPPEATTATRLATDQLQALPLTECLLLGLIGLALLLA
ncbi:hypothetical protein [Cypionkella sinensis]|uniref:Uncharacterized protein n=1 Tax=Cypionkella sinensis TaxID=1756043 RepID=A0ABV7IW61_9RHOB